MRVVAIEEHYILPGSPAYATASAALGRAPDETVDERLADMDAAGIDVQVLSVPLFMPADFPDESLASLVASANSDMHAMADGHPDRFAAFAVLPCTRPDAAAVELERTVTQLGFVGAMISGTIGGRFLDDDMFSPILENAARLDVPIYLHPGPPPTPVAEAYYSGFQPAINRMLATGAYGWHYETSLHVTRMIIAGVFDRFPNLKIVIGHLGEGLPFHFGRIEDFLSPLTSNLRKPIRQYLCENVWITTSGYFYDGPFQLTRQTFGDDRLIFSVDYPFASNRQARDWFDHLDLPSDVREKIAHGTADDLLKLHAS